MTLFSPSYCCTNSSGDSSRDTNTSTASIYPPESIHPYPVTVHRLAVPIESPAWTMTSTPPTPHSQPPPLSLFVLLPASAHSDASEINSAQAQRPSPLVSRQSGSRIPSLRTLKDNTALSSPSEDTPEIDKVVNAGRRLSLAPGIGAGIQPRGTSPRGDSLRSQSVAEEPTPLGNVISTGSSSSRAPAFGSRPLSGAAPATAGRSRRRPQTASGTGHEAPRGSGSRGSILVTGRGGMMGSGSSIKTRPGWEGDEVVGMLRGSGLEGEFTCFRNRQHDHSYVDLLNSSRVSHNSVAFQPLVHPSPRPLAQSHLLILPTLLPSSGCNFYPQTLLCTSASFPQRSRQRALIRIFPSASTSFHQRGDPQSLASSLNHHVHYGPSLVLDRVSYLCTCSRHRSNYNTARVTTTIHLASRLYIAKLRVFQPTSNHRPPINPDRRYSYHTRSPVRFGYNTIAFFALATRNYTNCRLLSARYFGQSKAIRRRVAACCVGSNSSSRGNEGSIGA